MLLKMNGFGRSVRYFQLVQLFYPASSFDEEHPEMELTLLPDFSGVEIIQQGRTWTVENREERTEDGILRALYRAFAEKTGNRPPWGVVTGVRPGKVLSRLLARGLSQEEAARELEEYYLLTPGKARLLLETERNQRPIIDGLPKNSAALYFAIPFCPTKCGYCTFVSGAGKRALALIPEYLELLEGELRALGGVCREAGVTIDSVYIGGGTPTILEEGQLGRLLDTLHGSFDLSRVREFTAEGGRPDTITKEKLHILKENGVDRISVNPQTLKEETLRLIGRNHTSEDFLRAFALARETGFSVINTDLIAGLPGENPADFEGTLTGILDLKPENITVHTLSLKKGSRLWFEFQEGHDHPQTERMLEIGQELLFEKGYGPYYLYRQKNMLGSLENVGYSLPGRESIYNIAIMEEVQDILSCGAGSVTKLLRDGKIERLFHLKYPFEYNNDTGRIAAQVEQIRTFYEQKKVTGYVSGRA